jgi:hypothetical protein
MSRARAVIAVAGIALLGARTAEAIIVACNESDVYAVAPNCPITANPCNIDDIVICSTICGGSCTYDFGTKELVLKGTLGSFISATGSSANISVYAGTVRDESFSSLRFDTGGASKSLLIEARTGYVSIQGTIQSTGTTAGFVTLQAATFVGLGGNIDVHATGTTAVGGNVGLFATSSTGFVNIVGSINASGPGGGGLVFAQAAEISVYGPVTSRGTGAGQGGFIELATIDSALAHGAIVTVQAALDASVTASTSTARGGFVFIGMTSGQTQEPVVTAVDTVDVGATAGTGGVIQIDAKSVASGTGSSGLFANAASTTGSHGGTIVVTASDTTTASTFHNIQARGYTGGTLTIRGGADMSFDADVRADSNQGPDGKGGSISIRTATDNGVPNCWDCREPGNTCACGVPASCTQKIQINEDVIATGSGNQGTGGVITLEAPYVYMRASGNARRLIANATSGTDSTSGTQPGFVRVRARDSQFRARTDSGTNHKIRALPDKTGVTETCITQPLGGNYAPPFFLCGPTYAPQCNPG